MSENSPQEVYEERLTRVKDAAALKVPDRVPVFGWLSLRLRHWVRNPRVEITLSLMTSCPARRL